MRNRAVLLPGLKRSWVCRAEVFNKIHPSPHVLPPLSPAGPGLLLMRNWDEPGN